MKTHKKQQHKNTQKTRKTQNSPTIPQTTPNNLGGPRRNLGGPRRATPQINISHNVTFFADLYVLCSFFIIVF